MTKWDQTQVRHTLKCTRIGQINATASRPSSSPCQGISGKAIPREADPATRYKNLQHFKMLQPSIQSDSISSS